MDHGRFEQGGNTQGGTTQGGTTQGGTTQGGTTQGGDTPSSSGTGRRSSACSSCGHDALPWLVMCARCDKPLTGGLDAPSAVTSPSPWVDIPVSADRPAEVALLCHFLADRGVAYEASRRFVTVAASDAVELVVDLEIWAFHHDLPDDDRHSDSLAATQRRVGSAVLDAIETATGVRPPTVTASPAVDEFEGEAVR